MVSYCLQKTWFLEKNKIVQYWPSGGCGGHCLYNCFQDNLAQQIFSNKYLQIMIRKLSSVLNGAIYFLPIRKRMMFLKFKIDLQCRICRILWADLWVPGKQDGFVFLIVSFIEFSPHIQLYFLYYFTPFLKKQKGCPL